MNWSWFWHVIHTWLTMKSSRQEPTILCHILRNWTSYISKKFETIYSLMVNKTLKLERSMCNNKQIGQRNKKHTKYFHSTIKFNFISKMLAISAFKSGKLIILHKRNRKSDPLSMILTCVSISYASHWVHDNTLQMDLFCYFTDLIGRIYGFQIKMVFFRKKNNRRSFSNRKYVSNHKLNANSY